MKKIAMIIGLFCIAGLALANPVKVNVTYSNIKALSNKLSTQDCQKLIQSSTFTFDQDNPMSFKASKQQMVKNSYTVIKTMDGQDQVLVKLGKSIVRSPKGIFRVNRVSYVKLQPNGAASGQLVLENLCSADFTSTRASS